MRTGTIRFIQKNGKPLFPVTRAEGVLVGNTTLDKVLKNHEGRIVDLRIDVDDITRLVEEDIEEAYNEGITT